MWIKKLLLSGLALLFLIGCSDGEGSFLNDKQVIKEVENQIGKEHVSIVEKTEASGAVTYQMKTDDRGIAFKAVCHPSISQDGTLVPSSVGVYDYVDAVQFLYKEELDALKETIPYNGKAVVHTREDLHRLCGILEEIDALWKKELKYHDAAFLKEYPLTVINVAHVPSGGGPVDFGCGVKIDGTIKADELEAQLLKQYREKTGSELE